VNFTVNARTLEEAADAGRELARQIARHERDSLKAFGMSLLAEIEAQTGQIVVVRSLPREVAEHGFPS
jgi:hypothetical protein